MSPRRLGHNEDLLLASALEALTGFPPPFPALADADVANPCEPSLENAHRDELDCIDNAPGFSGGR